MCVMQQPIGDRVGDRRLSDPAVPVLDGQLRGDHGGAPLGAIIDQLEQVVSPVSDSCRRKVTRASSLARFIPESPPCIWLRNGSQ